VPGVRRLIVLIAGALTLWALPAASASAQQVACGQVITNSITLDADLTCPGDGLVIGNDGITLDLGGHQISGGRGTGVDVAGHRHVTVRDGTLDGFRTHVQLGRTAGSLSDARIVELTFRNGEFALDGYADRSIIAFNTSADVRPQFGVFGGDLQVSGDRNLIVGNVARMNALAVGGARNRVIGNRVANLNAAPGIEGRTVIARNVALTFQLTGGPPDARAPTITLSNNQSVPRTPDQPFGQGGIYLIGASRTVVKDNVVTGADSPPFNGISVLSPGPTATGNVLVGNSIRGAQVNGIFVQGEAVDTVLLRNTALANGNDPFSFPGGHDGIANDSPTSTLTGNVANDNRNFGIESVPGATDGGGNRASGNGNPLQCLNVVCR
jgi:large repetitive protein